MKESIIITYHKNKDMLLYCLDRILKTTPNEVEILIIGNNINKSELDIDIPNSRCKYLKYPQNLQYPTLAPISTIVFLSFFIAILYNKYGVRYFTIVFSIPFSLTNFKLTNK